MTNELLLRDIEANDLLIFFEQQLDQDANYMAAFTAKDPTNQEAYIAHWHRNLADKTTINKTIIFDGQVVGSVSSYENEGKPEVTYWLGKEYWGKGIASQALTQFLEYIETRPLYAHVAEHNVGSRRVLEKCGFNVVAEDKFFSKVFGEDVEEYILILDPNEPVNTH